MARADVLVSADWTEQNLNTPSVVFVEIDEDVSAYPGGRWRQRIGRRVAPGLLPR